MSFCQKTEKESHEQIFQSFKSMEWNIPIKNLRAAHYK